jgi:hypothetical protein
MQTHSSILQQREANQHKVTVMEVHFVKKIDNAERERDIKVRAGVLDAKAQERVGALVINLD